MKKNEWFTPTEVAVTMGYSRDKRKRRRQHRRNAKKLMKNEGGFFNGYAARGSTVWQVAYWNLLNARML